MRLWVKWPLVFVLVLFALIPAGIQVIHKRVLIPKAALARTADVTSNKSEYPVITQSSFGFQCGTGKPTNCPNVTWPASIAQPGMIRLWDSQVQWNLLNPAPGVYNWKTLDAYLDAIAAHQPRDAMYTFGYTPCWATKGECERAWGSPFPPNDLAANGSPSFNAFVSELVGHCSKAGHCVKDLIKYWEMWNEANAEPYWRGTIPQLYELMAPAIELIRKKVPSALILTPPANRGDTDWMRSWLNEENKNGRLSDIYSFHLYLLTKPPEARFRTVEEMLALKNGTAGWRDTPWVNSETNFDPRTFACDSRYTADDCIGQMVRWHLLHFSFGAEQLSWYYFNTTIGQNRDYSRAYHTMMDWLVGGHFIGECSANGGVVTCPFVETTGHHARLVWNSNGESSYPPAAWFTDYKTLDGNTAVIKQGNPVPIGVKPIMLEAPN
jgi:hypothetical protein